MGIKQFFGDERVYMSIGLLVAVFVLIIFSYFVLPGSNLHGGFKLGEAVYLTLIFTLLVIVLYNVYYSMKHRKVEQPKQNTHSQH
jgi:Mn2+/Fe2+ NRAMP family transporter